MLAIYGNPFSRHQGGVEEHSRNLIAHLSKLREIELVVLSYDKDGGDLRTKDVDVTRLKPLISSPFIGIPVELARLARRAKNAGAEVVHLQGTHPLYCLLGMLTRKWTKTIITVHGYLGIEHKYKRRLERFLDFVFSVPLEKMALGSIPNIVVVNPRMKDKIAKMAEYEGESAVRAIPNGIDIEFIRAVEPTERIEGITVMYMGGLYELKGVDTLLKAFALLRGEISNLHLLIAGTGPSDLALRQLADDLKLGDCVEFLGYLDKHSKFSYLKSSDVFVLPSRWESAPIVLLESMACNTPVVASDVGGVSTIVEHQKTGMLFTPGDVNDLRNSLHYTIVNANSSKKMAEEALSRVQFYDWNIIANETAILYKEAH